MRTPPMMTTASTGRRPAPAPDGTTRTTTTTAARRVRGRRCRAPSPRSRPSWAARRAPTAGAPRPGHRRAGPPLAALAAADPAAQWRVILTDPAGRAIAVERVRRGRLAGNPGRAPGVTGRVTVIIPAATLDQPGQPGSADGTGIRAAVLRAARRAATRAEQAAAA